MLLDFKFFVRLSLGDRAHALIQVPYVNSKQQHKRMLFALNWLQIPLYIYITQKKGQIKQLKVKVFVVKT